MDSLETRIRELEAELAVRDNMGNEVLRILREATGKRDFHSEIEAAEWAAKLLAEARRDTERLAWCSLHKACAVEYWRGGWRVQNIYQVFMTDSHETPRAAIDAAMTEGK